MVAHHVGFTFREDYPEAERTEAKARVKTALEGLQGQIPGLISIQVLTEPLPSATVDFVLLCTLESPEAYLVYKDHPAHKEAGKVVKDLYGTRCAMDFVLPA